MRFNNITVLLGGNDTHTKMTAEIVVGQLKQMWEVSNNNVATLLIWHKSQL